MSARRPSSFWKRLLINFLGSESSVEGVRRSMLHPFIPSAFRRGRPVKCPNCGHENPGSSERCRRCMKMLPPTAAVRGGAYLPVWLVAILMMVVASVAFWLGLSSGRESTALDVPASSRPETAPLDGSGAANAALAIDPVATTAGETWAIYTSQDRLTDHPLFGARFGTALGTPFFTVLCAEGQGVLSLKRGLLPPTEGASQNAKSVVDTIRVGVRIGEREKDRVEVRFEEAAPESLEAIPKNPAAFLRRVAATRKIRTGTETFDPSTWGDPIERVIKACGFEEKPASPAKRTKARD